MEYKLLDNEEFDEYLSSLLAFSPEDIGTFYTWYLIRELNRRNLLLEAKLASLEAKVNE